MSVYFMTGDAKTLLKNFDERIEQSEPKGKITTWEKSDDGIYYTHKSPQWAKEAWFKPAVHSDRLLFNIIKPGNKNVSIIAYGYYHGHLIETFLNHFEDQFSLGAATAKPSKNDLVSD